MSVFSVRGKFVRHVGVGVLTRPTAVACSAFDELVVADGRGVRVFGVGGDMDACAVLTVRCSVMDVAVHGVTVFAKDARSECAIIV